MQREALLVKSSLFFLTIYHHIAQRKERRGVYELLDRKQSICTAFNSSSPSSNGRVYSIVRIIHPIILRGYLYHQDFHVIPKRSKEKERKKNIQPTATPSLMLNKSPQKKKTALAKSAALRTIRPLGLIQAFHSPPLPLLEEPRWECPPP